MNQLKVMFSQKKFWLFLLISTVFFGVFVIPEYATDTYAIFSQDWTYAFQHFMSLGRYVTAIFWAILMGGFHLKFSYAYGISFLLGIFFLTLALYKMNQIAERYMKRPKLAVLAAVLVVANAFSIELWMYFEKGMLVLSILWNVLAIEKLIEYFEGKKKSLWLVLGYLLLANCTYQGTVALFVALGVVIILKYAKNFWDFIQKNIVVAFAYAIPALCNYLSIKIIFATDRVAHTQSVMTAIHAIIKALPNNIIHSFGILPSYVWILFTLVITVFVLITQTYANGRQFFLKISQWIYIGIAVVFATVAPQILQDSVYMVPRDTYAMASLPGLLLLWGIYDQTDRQQKLEKFILGIVCIYLAIQWINFQSLAVDHARMNYMDRQIANQIGQAITEYEQQTGQKIEKIVCYQDQFPSWQYPGLRSIGDANIRAFYTEWSRVNILKMQLNRYDLQAGTNENEEYVKKFQEKNWDYYDKEQLIFEQNVLHLCCF